MGLFGKSKKEREKEYMNRLDVPLCLKEDFELIIDDVFTIMGGGTVVTGNISTGMCREGENACVYKTNGGVLETIIGNVKKCAVGKHPKSEKHGNTAQFSEVERSGTQENCGGIGSGCRLRLRPLPVLRRRQSQRVARIDPNAVVVDKNIAENDRFDLFSR